MKKLYIIHLFVIIYVFRGNAQCALKISDESGSGIMGASVMLHGTNGQCITPTDGCISGVRLNSGDSITVSKIGYSSWKGKYTPAHSVLRLTKSYIELPEAEIVYFKERKTLPYLSSKASSYWLAISKDNISTRSAVYKVKLPEGYTKNSHKIKEIRLKSKKLKENVPVQIHLYPSTADGLPDTATESKEPLILYPFEMGKRELVFDLSNKNVRIGSRDFFVQIEWLWPPGKEIDAATLTFPYYGVGPIVGYIDSNKTAGYGIAERRYLLLQVSYE